MASFIVVDASVAGAWLFAEPYSANAQPVLEAVDARRVVALAPDRFAEEMLRVCQKKILPPPDGAGVHPLDAWERFLSVVTSPIELLSAEELHERAWQLAFAAHLTTHDALIWRWPSDGAWNYGRWMRCLLPEGSPYIRRSMTFEPRSSHIDRHISGQAREASENAQI